MGSPKALLDFHGETFLDRLIRIFGSCCSSVTVVLGHNPDVILSGIRRPGDATFIRNELWERGQLTSMQAGLRALPSGIDAVLFSPVDYPGIDPETPAAVIAAWKNNPGMLLAVPKAGMRRGHPVLFHADLIGEFLALGLDGQAREVVHRHVDRTVYVPLNDQGTVTDVDDRAAYEELLRQSGATV